MVILTAEEVRELTGRVRPGWQARELKHLGIPYKRRSDGSILVLSVDLKQEQPDVSRREPQLRLS